MDEYSKYFKDVRDTFTSQSIVEIELKLSSSLDAIRAYSPTSQAYLSQRDIQGQVSICNASTPSAVLAGMDRKRAYQVQELRFWTSFWTGFLMQTHLKCTLSLAPPGAGNLLSLIPLR